MKKRNLLLTLIMAFCLPWIANAQQSLNEGFESTTFPPTDWTTIHVSGNNNWVRNTAYNHTTNGAAAAYMAYATNGHENYLVTPKLVPATGEALTFYATSQYYANTTLTIEVSTTSATAAAFTTTLATYTTGSSSANYIGTNSLGTWVELTIPATDLAPYVNQQIYIAFHVVDSNGSHLYIDDVSGVSLYVPACPKPSGLVVNGLTATWNAGTASQWNLQYKKVSESTWTSVNGLTAATYTFSGLPTQTDYEVQVQADCGPETSEWTNSFNFTTPCDAVTTFPWSENFESYSSGNFTDPCWVNEHISGNGTQIFKVYTSTNGSNSTHQLQLPDMTSGTMTKLRLPEMALTTGDSYLFSIDVYRVNATSYTGEGIRVYASTDGEIEGATELAFISRNFGTGDGNLIPAESAAGWYTYELPIPFTGTCYIVLRGESKFGSSTYMDNFKVKKELPCVKPSVPTFVSSTTTSATLSWTNGAEGQTAWQIAYSTNPNFNPDEVTPVDVTSNPGTINGLTAATTYYAYVRANCGNLGYSEWSTAYCQFATACDVIPALGYSENFDSYTAGNNVLPNCWSYINTTTYSSYQGYPRVYANGSYSIYANSAPNCMYLYSYYSSWTDYDPQPQYAILPEMTGLNGKQVTLMAKGYTSTSTFKIGTMSDPTDASTFVAITEQALTTSYQEFEYVIPASVSGNYLAIMIDAATESRANNGAYIDDISIGNVPTCLKPSSPMLETPSSRTAHTATLKWTNGEEGQSAWQIAYSTTADFNPDQVTPVDVTTNPATISGLNASTTYYAYVRANCGHGDLSAWSGTKASFSTTTATAVPTGLAVDATTITSESAKVTWTGVATNDNHESFEVYYSRLSTRPDPLENDSLITGITATSYTFNHLDAEKTYYVWVRDNCGSDGLSAWSSRANFTTASSCQTPDGLAATNVTNESATITWNTYGLNAFNLRYSTDGTTWTTVSNVNTPYTLNNTLTANTAYQVQVQATCADAETWSTVLRFTTACDAITDLPWNENFDAYTGSTSTSAPTGYPNDELPNCWQFLNRSNSTSNYPQVFISSNSGYPVSGKCLFFKSSMTTPLYAILPAFEEEIAGLQLTFTYRNEGTNDSNGTLIVGYMTNPADATTFTTVLTCERTTTLTVKDVLFNNAPAGSYIAFKYQGGSSNNYYLSIDNVKVDVIPTCVKPTALECTGTTTTTATFSWTNGANDQIAWQICLNGDEEHLIMANSNPFTVEGLNASTAYTAKVRAYCSADDQSDWSNEVSFATECAVFAALGYSENFDNYTAGNNVLPLCWSYINTTTNSSYQGYPKIYNYSSNSTPNCLSLYSYAYYSYGSTSYDPQPQYAILPEMTGLAGTQVSLWAKGSTSTSTFKIGTMTDPADASTFVAITEQALTTSHQQFEYLIPTDAQGHYLAIMIDAANEDRTTNGVYIDDISIAEPPACPKPTDLTVVANSATPHSVQLSWVSDATAWIVAYKTADDADFTEVNATENPFTLTGLTDGKTYTAKVCAVCDGTPGEWTSTTVSFTTPIACPAPTNLAYSGTTGSQTTLNWSGTSDSYDVLYRTAAYAEGIYEQFNTSGTPSGWTQYSGLVDEVIAGTATLSTGGNWNTNSNALGTYNIKLNIYGTGVKSWLVTPEFDLNQNLSFDLALTDFGNADPIEDATAQADDRFVVLIYADNAWTILREWNNTGSEYVYNTIATTGEHVDINLSAYVGKTVKIAFYGESTASGGDNDLHIDNVYCGIPHEAGEWQTAAEGVTDNTYTLTGLNPETDYEAKVLSNCEGETGHETIISFTTEAACMVPTELTVVSVTTTTAELTWTSSSTAWQIQVNEEEPVEVTSIPYTLEGLTPATTYTFKVRANCDGSYTDWSNAASFTTDCDAITTFPWNEDFESYSASSNGVKFEAPCWVNEHISGSGSYFFEVYSGTNGTNSTKQLRLRDMSSGTLTKLMLPEMTLPSNYYLFSIDVYRVSSTANYGEGIRVFVSTDGEIEGATELAFISRSYATSDGNLIPAESASGWYTYELPIGISGTCYIILRGESLYGSSTYMDNFAVKQMPTCLKPAAFECTATTTTTATFSWINGAADQTAWQICLNGDETNLIMADSNPFTVEDLIASTSYTAKVRAYCSEEDQSDWSNEVSFATECEPYTITAENSFVEDFEGYTGTTYSSGDEIPLCWDSYSEGSTVPHITSSGSYHYVHSGTNTLYFYGAAQTNSYIALPEFTNDLNTLEINFWMQFENAGYGELSLGYITAEDNNFDTYQVIATYEPHSDDMVECNTLIENVPAAATRLAFRWAHPTTSWHGCCIDDVEVSLLPPTTLTQTIELAAGANWVSFYVDITLDDLKAALAAASPDASIKISGQNSSTTYVPRTHRWSGNLQWDLAQMYKIRVADACEISLEGMPIDPAEHPVTIVNGANYIAFPLTENMSLTNAFAGFAVNGDKILSQNSTATYNRNRWQGSGLTNLELGKGYIYKSNVQGDRTLVFPTNAKK